MAVLGLTIFVPEDCFVKNFYFFNFSLWFCFVVVTYYGVLYMGDTATEYVRLEFPVKPVTICLFPLNAEARHSARNFGIVGMEVPASTASPWCSSSLDCIITGASVHKCAFYSVLLWGGAVLTAVLAKLVC